MGVYIKGMEMPTACYKCELYESETYWCRGAKRDVEDPFADDGVATFCPLVPVPPHGRLIDADAMCDGLVRNNPVVIYAGCMPTIIPAEEGEW